MSNIDRRTLLKLAGLIGVTAAMPFSFARASDQPLVVGFIYVGARDDFGYNQAHAEAAAIIKTLPNVVVVEEENVPETVAVQKSMEAMIRQDGATLIFPTSFGYFDPHVIKMAERFPDVHFAHCGGLWTEGVHPTNAGSFFGYIDEGQYLNGVVAGFASLDLNKWNPLSWLKTYKAIPRASVAKLGESSTGIMATHLGYLLKKPELMTRIWNDLSDFTEKHSIRPITT